MRENRNEGFTHRLSQSRLYSVWSSIKCRCKNQSHPSYRNYGAKGITICEEWDNDFMEFYQWAMQTGYDENSPKGSCTIDRIDYTKGYCPENCRWISLQEQSLNRKCNRYIDFNGQKMTISQWSQQTGIHPGTIRYRIDAGWDVSEALTKIPN